MDDRAYEATRLSIVNYLGVDKSDLHAEHLNPALESFLKAFIARQERWQAPPFTQFGLRELILLTESWLVANPTEQPLWPKGYEPERSFSISSGDPRPDWMKRRWV